MEGTPRTQLWRRVVARILVVLGVLLIAVTIVAGYIRWQALDEETFRDTANELIADQVVRDEIAATLVEQLFASVDVGAALEERLPSDQQRLSGIAAAGLRVFADRAAQELLDRPRAQQLWVDAVSASQEELVALLRDEQRLLTIEERGLVLDLRPILASLGERLSILGNLSDRLPDDAGLIVIMQADQLERAQDVTSLFETVAAWIWVLPFLLWGIALWLVPGRRRIELRAIALGLVVAGLLVLVVRALAGRYVVDELAGTATVRQAAEHAWDIVTQLLADGAWAAIAIGLVALLGVWVTGPTTSGTAVRRWLSPLLARAELTYGIAAVLFLLFVWWGPFAQARRPLYLFVTAVLLAAGIEVVRRQAIREFPEAATTSPREMLAPLDRARRRRTADEAAAPRADAAELEQLARLHREGVLDDEEFRVAKARLLGAGPAS